MRLVVTTPTAVIVDVEGIRHLVAEDETGSFGIEPGHADFLTVLSVSVISWRDQAGAAHHVAVRGGVLTVHDGQLLKVATRDAVSEDSLTELSQAVLARFRDDAATESASRVSTARMHLATMRQLQRFLDAGRRPLPVGGPPRLDTGILGHELGTANGNPGGDPGE
jgi:F-type H+-transporting ATPase subunit epsilon